MLSEINDPSDEEAGLITSEQIKLFVDRMILNNQFNEEYVAATGNWGDDGPIDRWLIQLELWIKQSRSDLVRNNIGSILDEMKELSAQLDFPIEPGSKNELLVGRAMLRAEANYFEETIRREREERGLPDCPNLRSLSLDDLRAKLLQAWQKELQPSSISRVNSINSAEESQTKHGANQRLKKLPEGIRQGGRGSVIGKRRGRAPTYNWEAAALFVEEQLNDKGHWEVSPVEGWRSQSDLVEAVILFLDCNGEGGPSVTSVKDNINPVIEQWLKLHPSGL